MLLYVKYLSLPSETQQTQCLLSLHWNSSGGKKKGDLKNANAKIKKILQHILKNIINAQKHRAVQVRY